MAIARKPVFFSSFLISIPLGVLAAFAFVTLFILLLTLISPILLLGSAFMLVDFVSKKLEAKEISPIASVFVIGLKAIAMIPTILLLVPAILIAALIIIPAMFVILSLALSMIISDKMTNLLLEEKKDPEQVEIEDWMHVDEPIQDTDYPQPVKQHGPLFKRPSSNPTTPNPAVHNTFFRKT